MYFVANNFEEFIYMVYNNKDIYGQLIDIYGQLIVDDKKLSNKIQRKN